MRKEFTSWPDSHEEGIHPPHHCNHPAESSFTSNPLPSLPLHFTWNPVNLNFGDTSSFPPLSCLEEVKAYMDEKCILTFANQITACYFLWSVKWILIEELFFLFHKTGWEGGSNYTIHQVQFSKTCETSFGQTRPPYSSRYVVELKNNWRRNPKACWSSVYCYANEKEIC